MEIGIISDTHIGTAIKKLPREIENTFYGVDIIVHAGDITHPKVLKLLRKIAPVKAIKGNRGNEKKGFASSLPSQLVLKISRYNIGVVHGLSNDLERSINFLLYKKLHFYKIADEILFKGLTAHFKQPVDCIIFGDTHVPLIKTVGGTLFFNPGAAYSTRTRKASVGILKISKNKLSPKIIYF